MNKPLPKDIAYHSLVMKIYQIYLRSNTKNALTFAVDLLKVNRGLRFEKLKDILENAKIHGLTEGDIKNIINNAKQAFAIPREAL